ncbi:CPBP family intramembrane metalloprotease [Pedobacter chinensis]|uniref:CPBP family intramembrane metalloprotease n=1 Tax=Pedobacter chinensis TaxID=2282421 RepID=A0A369PXG3_9SPHI|nr:type II CAAX endopeptidase family protein [Pedobacter chinensis]RDC57313.1 CPBP family intramembrane metalloprotease [Pedobacter chinensis]
MKNYDWLRVLKILFPYIFVVGFFQYLAYLILGIQVSIKPRDINIYQKVVIAIFTVLGTFLVIWAFNKYVDKQKFNVFQLNKFNKKSFFYGLAIGIIIMCLGFAILFFTNQIFLKTIQCNFSNFLLSIVFFACVSFNEEFLMRGYVLNNLLNSFNKFISLIISAILFALMHFANPYLNSLSFVNLFLAGILLGSFYIYTKNLWFSFGLHFSWNFFQGTILGFSVSGIKFPSILMQERLENNIWNGGDFGFEGSMLCLVFQIISIIAVYRLFKQRNFRMLMYSGYNDIPD